MKKTLICAISITSLVSPLVSVVACGADANESKVLIQNEQTKWLIDMNNLFFG